MAVNEVKSVRGQDINDKKLLLRKIMFRKKLHCYVKTKRA